MIVKLDLRFVRGTTLGEYATRFVFGGAVTLLAGLIADKFGPAIVGLFLAFPAIFPAGASLIEKYQHQKNERAGLRGTDRGRLAAGVDAAGAAIGCLGLMGFALLAWKLITRLALWQTLVLATALVFPLFRRAERTSSQANKSASIGAEIINNKEDCRRILNVIELRRTTASNVPPLPTKIRLTN